MKRLLPCLIAALFLGACTLVEPEHERIRVIEWTWVPIDSIITESAPYLLVSEKPPLRTRDSLFATVNYSGGCAPHDFTTHGGQVGQQSVLWLQHDAHGDLCEAWIQDHLRLPLPLEARHLEDLMLLTPDGSLVPLPFIE